MTPEEIINSEHDQIAFEDNTNESLVESAGQWKTKTTENPEEGVITKIKKKRTGKYYRIWLRFIRFIIAFRAIFVRLVHILYIILATIIVLFTTGKIHTYIIILVVPVIVELIWAVYEQRQHQLRLIAEEYSYSKFILKSRAISKWFSFALFTFIMCACPSIWILELNLNEMNMKKSLTYQLQKEDKEPFSMIFAGQSYDELIATNNEIISQKIIAQIKEASNQFKFIGFDIEWVVRIMQQILLLTVIIGRWLLPRDGMSRDQLSQLLLINIGTAADILDFLDPFNDEKVKKISELKVILLCIWQLSLFQFCFNKTATMKPSERKDGCYKYSFLFSTELWAIFMSLLLQDVPFLILRLTLIFKYHIATYNNVFFSCKNSLIILLQLFRSMVIISEK